MLRRSFRFLVDFMPIAMPALSPSMDTGTLIKWNVKSGDKINPGMSFCSIQTDKAVVSFDNQLEEGFFAKAIAKEGDVVPVGGIIGVMVENESDVSKSEEYVPPLSTLASSATTANSTTTTTKAIEKPTPEAPMTAHASSSPASLFGGSLQACIEASGPAVNRIAHHIKKNGDLSEILKGIAPTGKNGRYTKTDLISFSDVVGPLENFSCAPTGTSKDCKIPNISSAVCSCVIKPGVVYNWNVKDTEVVAKLVTSMMKTVPKPSKSDKYKKNDDSNNEKEKRISA